MPRFFILTVLSGLLLLSTGCGVAGGTYARKVKLNEALMGSSLPTTVAVASVVAREGAGVNQAIGAYNLGKFDEGDVDTLRRTIEVSLPSVEGSSHRVRVIVQHAAVAFTNNRGAMLSIVDWCVTKDRDVLASERFYAAYDTGDKLFGTQTLGMAKNRVLYAIAARISERALATANGLPLPPSPALTFDDPEAATGTLPARMDAASNSVLSATVQQTMLHGLEGALQMLPAFPIPPVDWSQQL